MAREHRLLCKKDYITAILTHRVTKVLYSQFTVHGKQKMVPEVGDTIWCAEEWATIVPYHTEENGCKKCTRENRRYSATDDLPEGSKWCSPIYMKRRCCRILLEVVDVTDSPYSTCYGGMKFVHFIVKER